MHSRCSNTKQPDESLALLTRLSQKPGVQSTLILSRENGAIVRTSGLISKSSSANPNSTLPASSETSHDNFANVRKQSGIHSAEDVAGMVWSFLGAAGNLVDELDREDEVRLLRLRTKKNELVIVPGVENQVDEHNYRAGGVCRDQKYCRFYSRHIMTCILRDDLNRS